MNGKPDSDTVGPVGKGAIKLQIQRKGWLILNWGSSLYACGKTAPLTEIKSKSAEASLGPEEGKTV